MRPRPLYEPLPLGERRLAFCCSPPFFVAFCVVRQPRFSRPAPLIGSCVRVTKLMSLFLFLLWSTADARHLVRNGRVDFPDDSRRCQREFFPFLPARLFARTPSAVGTPPPSTVPADGGVETAQNWMNLGCVRPNSTVWIVSFFFSSDGLRQVAGMLCVFSLYTLWKEEKNVNRRLRDLTMVISPNFIQFLLFFFTLINAIRQSIRHHQPNQSIASESFLGPRIGLLAFLLGYFYFWKKRSSTTGWVYFDTILSGIFSVFLCAFLFFSTALLFFLRISIYFGFIKFNLAYWVFTEWCKRSLP